MQLLRGRCKKSGVWNPLWDFESFSSRVSKELYSTAEARLLHLHFYGLSIFPRDLDRNIGTTLVQLGRRDMRPEKFRVSNSSDTDIVILL